MEQLAEGLREFLNMTELVPVRIQQYAVLGGQGSNRLVKVSLAPIDGLQCFVPSHTQRSVPARPGIASHALNDLRATQIVEELGECPWHLSACALA